MPRYFTTLPLLIGALILLVGCTQDDVSVDKHEAEAQRDESKLVDTLDDVSTSADEAEATAKQTADENARAGSSDASRARAAQRRPRKIQRPPARSSQSATAKDATDPRDEDTPSPSSTEVEAPNAPRQNTPNAPVEDTDDETNAEEYTRHFAFDGSDEELEMILGIREVPPFRVDDLLTVEDLRLGLGRHTPTKIGQIQGQEPTPFYNNLWFQSNEAGRLGLVLQYWHFQTPKAAQIHYEMLHRTARSEPKPVGISSDAYYIDIDGTVTLVALNVGNKAVTSLTCDVENCFVPQLMRWTTLIHERAAQ